MIEIYEGLLGSGKSLGAMETICEELRNGNRFITVNEAFGLKLKEVSRLHAEKFGEDFNFWDRIRVLTHEECFKFWRHCVKGVDLTEDVEVMELSGKMVPRPDYEKLKDIADWPGGLIIIDEAPEYFPAEAWGEIGDECKHFFRHSRKVSIDVILISQDRSMIAKPMRVFVQQTTVFRNLAYESIAFFRAPGRIYKRVHFKTPDEFPKPMRSSVYKVDKNFLGSQYDTSAGVGMAGGRKADLERRKRGLPPWVLVLVILFGLTGMWYFPRLLTHVLTSATGAGAIAKKDLKKTVEMPANTQISSPPQNAGVSQVLSRQKSPAQVVQEAEGVRMLGYYKLDGAWHAQLSDGRTVDSRDKLFERLSPDAVIYAGKIYPFAHSQTLTNPVVASAPRSSSSSGFPGLSMSPAARRYYRVHDGQDTFDLRGN